MASKCIYTHLVWFMVSTHPKNFFIKSARQFGSSISSSSHFWGGK